MVFDIWCFNVLVSIFKINFFDNIRVFYCGSDFRNLFIMCEMFFREDYFVFICYFVILSKLSCSKYKICNR